MEDLIKQILNLIENSPRKQWTNVEIINELGLTTAVRNVRRAMARLAEQGKVQVCGREGSNNIYKKTEKILTKEQIAYHAGFEAGVRASNIDAFNEGRKMAVRSIAKKLNINLD